VELVLLNLPRRPGLRAEAGRVLDLCETRWYGWLLKLGDFVVCADEKPSIQARRRIARGLGTAPREGQKVELTYERMGAVLPGRVGCLAREGPQPPRSERLDAADDLGECCARLQSSSFSVAKASPGRACLPPASPAVPVLDHSVALRTVMASRLRRTQH